MPLREIPARDWRTFLEQFSRAHRAWLATIERVDASSGNARPYAVERPLAGIEVSDDESRPSIEIRLQDGSPRSDAVRIDGAARLLVDETPGGAARGLEVITDAGARTRLRFHAAPKPEMLDGLAPGELLERPPGNQ